MPICSKKKRIGLVSDNQGLLKPAKTAAICTAFCDNARPSQPFCQSKTHLKNGLCQLISCGQSCMTSTLAISGQRVHKFIGQVIRYTTYTFCYLGVHTHSVCLTCISMTFEMTCVHYCQQVQHMLLYMNGKVYAEKDRESERSFKHLTECKDMVISQDGHSLLCQSLLLCLVLINLIMGVVAAFSFSFLASIFTPVSQLFFLALITIFLPF